MAERAFKKPTAGKNFVNFSGRVVKKTEKYTTNGNLIVSIMLRIPAKNPKYSTVLWLKAFNSNTPGGKNLADEIVKDVKEDSNYSFTGYVTVRSYEKKDQDGNNVKAYAQDFVVNKFEEADEAEVVAEAEAGSGKPAEDDVPF